MSCPKISALFFLSLVCSVFILTGCSEMQFVGKVEQTPEKDPREDIVLTNVSTQMTSAGLVQQKVAGEHAVFSNSNNDLTIRDIKVTTLGDNKETQSITKADVGQIYFSDQPQKHIGRKDMKFAGHVLYRNPQKNDPTTDSLRMTSELVVWDESQKKFISPQGYEMLLLPKGQKPVRQRGKSFEATQDLSRFVVKAGAVTTDMDSNPTESRAEMLAQFEAWSAAAHNEAAKPSNVPLTMPINVR